VSRIIGTLHDELCILWQYLAEVFIEWEILQTKLWRKSRHTFFWKSCLLRDNVERYGTARQTTGDNIMRRMRFSCWTTKATDTHSEYETYIAFPRQRWSRERASVLRDSCIACLVRHIRTPWLSQWCRWRCRSCGIWCFVHWRILTNTVKRGRSCVTVVNICKSKRIRILKRLKYAGVRLSCVDVCHWVPIQCRKQITCEAVRKYLVYLGG
jgi:hypothetical protein